MTMLTKTCTTTVGNHRRQRDVVVARASRYSAAIAATAAVCAPSKPALGYVGDSR